MVSGFSIIGVGVWKIFENPQNLGPSIVAAASGILVQFIGATFLIVYKSTVSQARDYVTILERINAVGMSVQILENIDSAQKELRDGARVEIAKSLLLIYRKSEKDLLLPHKNKKTL
jgi:putative ubiquitin-RnfH superfamily antitoxin RatB of RatAB toxin-antitoxin module